MHIINFKKKLTAFFLAASAVCTLYAQQELSLLQPEKTTDILQKETEFIIRTDKKNARIYINGNFMGLSPLTITELIPGEYRLSIQKESRTKTFQIEVKRFIRQEYYIDMSDETQQAESDNGCTFIKAICPVCAICYLCDISAKGRTYIN